MKLAEFVVILKYLQIIKYLSYLDCSSNGIHPHVLHLQQRVKNQQEAQLPICSIVRQAPQRAKRRGCDSPQ